MATRKLTIKETSARTGLPTGTIAYAARTGRLRAYKVSAFGPFYFDPADVDRWLADMRTDALAPTKKRRVRAGK